MNVCHTYVTRFAKGGLIRHTCTISIHRFHNHSIATLINKHWMCLWMPTAHQSAFAVPAEECQASTGAWLSSIGSASW